ncbi:MAG TPA: GAF domain-containing protein, partial [Streptosporangiaceae bacterium]
MAQQVGSSTSGIAAADREIQVATPEAAPAEAGPSAAVPEETGQRRDGREPGARRVRGWLRRTPSAAVVTTPRAPSVMAAGPELDLASNDPLVGYLLSAASAVDITALQLQSPALRALREAGVVLVVPLISSGSLVGLLSLGPRRSERGYSTDDLRLLNSLAGYAAPAMRVGQLVRQQQAEARQRERIEQEL